MVVVILDTRTRRAGCMLYFKICATSIICILIHLAMPKKKNIQAVKITRIYQFPVAPY